MIKTYKNINIQFDLLNRSESEKKNVKNESDFYHYNSVLCLSLYSFNSIHVIVLNRLASNLHLTFKLDLLNRSESEYQMRLEKKYISFKEMKAHLTNNKADTLTFAVDQLLLKANSLQDLIDKIAELKEVKFSASNDFKNAAIIKKHIRYRQTHNRVVFSVNKKHQLRMINIDYESESAQDRLTF